MKLQRINTTVERPDILRAKRRYGFWFGITVGLGFSVFTWGTDAVVLSRYHGMYPWFKFIVGSMLCMASGAITGWLVARVGKAMYGLIMWLVTASLFAWLTINVPLKFTPRFIAMVQPEIQGLLHYTYHSEFGTRVAVAYTWIAIFVAIIGILQLPLSDPAVFSTSVMGRIAPLVITVVMMSICGVIVDNSMVNQPLRSAVMALDNTVQFLVDNQGKKVDKAESRKMHTGAFNTTKDLVAQERSLIVNGFDAPLGEISILARFEQGWVECLVMYDQPLSCKEADISR